MSVPQKLILLTTGPEGTRGLAEVNEHLRQGWRVKQATPMGGGGAAEGFAAVIVLERSGDESEAVLERLEEEIEEAIEGGDGADVEALGLDLPPEDE